MDMLEKMRKARESTERPLVVVTQPSPPRVIEEEKPRERPRKESKPRVIKESTTSSINVDKLLKLINESTPEDNLSIAPTIRQIKKWGKGAEIVRLCAFINLHWKDVTE